MADKRYISLRRGRVVCYVPPPPDKDLPLRCLCTESGSRLAAGTSCLDALTTLLPRPASKLSFGARRPLSQNGASHLSARLPANFPSNYQPPRSTQPPSTGTCYHRDRITATALKVFSFQISIDTHIARGQPCVLPSSSAYWPRAPPTPFPIPPPSSSSPRPSKLPMRPSMRSEN